jgi:hypothetical protein
MDCDNWCSICLEELKPYQIVRLGCCSLELCIDCVKTCKKCSQCNAPYFWVGREEALRKKYEIDEIIYQKELVNLSMKNYNLVENNKYLQERVEEMKQDVTFTKHDLHIKIYDNIKLQSQLNTLTEYINTTINEENKKKDIKNIIDKYNLL